MFMLVIFLNSFFRLVSLSQDFSKTGKTGVLCIEAFSHNMPRYLCLYVSV